jgi:hypothetical protein
MQPIWRGIEWIAEHAVPLAIASLVVLAIAGAVR